MAVWFCRRVTCSFFRGPSTFLDDFFPFFFAGIDINVPMLPEKIVGKKDSSSIQVHYHSSLSKNIRQTPRHLIFSSLRRYDRQEKVSLVTNPLTGILVA